MSAIRPRWRCPSDVRALVTTRQTGNLATHVGDPAEAADNRQRLVEGFSLPREPAWLEQVHGNDIHVVSEGPGPDDPPVADAAYTAAYNRPLAVMVADCLPVLLASPEEVAIVHAGWRGLARGIIGRTVVGFRNRDIAAWLGPSIGPCHYEVDWPVRSAFDGAVGFSRGRDDDHFMMDLPAIARAQLTEAGVHKIEGARVCTYCDTQFFSHRRDPAEGRFAAILWREM